MRRSHLTPLSASRRPNCLSSCFGWQVDGFGWLDSQSGIISSAAGNTTAGDSRRSSTHAVRKLTSNPVIDAGFQQVERQASTTENFIMKRSDIEARTKLLLGAIAQIENLELTDLVAEALSWPRNIAVDFSLDRRLICSAAFAEVSHCLFAGPTLGVNAGVDNKANGTDQLQREPSIIGGRILEK